MTRAMDKINIFTKKAGLCRYRCQSDQNKSGPERAIVMNPANVHGLRSAEIDCLWIPTPRVCRSIKAMAPTNAVRPMTCID